MPTLRFLLNLQSQVHGILKEVRFLSQNLRPSIIEHLGLLPAIESLANGLCKNHGVELRFVLKGEAVRFKPEVELSLYRIIQEALNNILRHAKASRVELMLDFNEDTATFVIQDNGRGMQEPTRPFHDYLRQGKLGLIGMSERVKLIGGKMQLASSSEGTALMITLPPEGLSI